MAWPVFLTKRQSSAIRAALGTYCELVRGTETGWALAVVLSMMDRGIALDVAEQRLVRSVLDEVFSMQDDEAYDEHLESAYFKLYGVWPVEPQWFIKRDGLKPLD